MNNDSGPIKILQAVWDHANEGKGHSWNILNGALSSALNIAIESGFKFHEDDFATICKRFDGHYWMGNSTGKILGEGFYSMAAGGGTFRRNPPNRSACISFEKWIGRKPFILNGDRLAIYSRIEIAGKKYFVTSFSDDHSSIGISGYHSNENPYGKQEGKPTKRFKLTHEEVKMIEKGKFTL